jgi:hypothetical protein
MMIKHSAKFPDIKEIQAESIKIEGGRIKVKKK